ncbi:MAG: hypothetical protein AB7L41_13010, partial [Flavobacteriaceae bacterium]
DISGRRIAVGQTYPLIALIAALVTWETDVFGLITFASRCFAMYYAVQCMEAARIAFGLGLRARAAGFASLALLCLAVVVFGIPAEGG